MNTGVEVLGTYSIKVKGKTYSPWHDAGIKVGDKIIMADNQEVKSLSDLLDVLKNCNNKSFPIVYVHNNEEIMKMIKPVLKEDGSYSLGIYVKDKIVGVGTLTYIIPTHNIYGALGHSISDNCTFIEGVISHANVVDIKKATENNVGEKRATIDDMEIGDIVKNTETGIHGKVSSIDQFNSLRRYKIGKRDTVKKGSASILTTIDGKNIEEFSIEIVGIEKQDKKDIKGLKIKITDERLLDKTGGIVQGMSGSPIIQNGNIIGALTHVLVSNPDMGYGIYIEWMLLDMDIHLE